MVIKHNKESTPHLKRTLTIELKQANTRFTFQQALHSATLLIGILLVHSTFCFRSVVLKCCRKENLGKIIDREVLPLIKEGLYSLNLR